jgi:structural maintenance of chromosome 1
VDKSETLQEELKNAKRELENAQSERTRVTFVTFLFCVVCLTHAYCGSKLEIEINEKLQECHVKLLQAGVDQKESEKEAKRKETFASLQRIFPGKQIGRYSILLLYRWWYRCPRESH